jgi:hypothetical protein
MKDSDLRGSVLQKFYDLRHNRDGVIALCTIVPEGSTEQEDIIRYANICDQLAQHELITWHPLKTMVGTIGGMGQITARGVDVVEETVKPPITITLHDHSVSVLSSSNVQIGDRNTQGINLKVGRLLAAIDHSSASEGEKAEAKSLLKKLSENKLVQTALTTVLGVVLGTRGAN